MKRSSLAELNHLVQVGQLLQSQECNSFYRIYKCQHPTGHEGNHSWQHNRVKREWPNLILTSLELHILSLSGKSELYLIRELAGELKLKVIDTRESLVLLREHKLIKIVGKKWVKVTQLGKMMSEVKQ